jgi:hypothetical protein
MTSSIKNRFLILSALFLSLHLGHAQPPSGLVAFSFGPENAPVYDVSGPYRLEHVIIGAGGVPLPMTYEIEMTQDARGRLQGAGETVVRIGNGDGAGEFAGVTYRVSGRISGGGANTFVNFNVRLTGNGIFAGVQRPFSSSISYKLRVDAGEMTLAGTARGASSISGFGSSSIKEDVVVALPGDVDGAWTLEMNVLPLGKLNGSATIYVSDYSSPNNTPDMPTDRILDGKLSGSYKAATDISRLKVSGQGASSGNVLDVSLTSSGASHQVIGLKGTVLGQRVRF